MIPTIGLLLCVYLVFKGVEILQIAFASNREDRRFAMTLGWLALVGSVVIAAFFALIFITSGTSTPDFPRR